VPVHASVVNGAPFSALSIVASMKVGRTAAGSRRRLDRDALAPGRNTNVSSTPQVPLSAVSLARWGRRRRSVDDGRDSQSADGKGEFDAAIVEKRAARPRPAV
jgi:hypothetical protein